MTNKLQGSEEWTEILTKDSTIAQAWLKYFLFLSVMLGAPSAGDFDSRNWNQPQKEVSHAT